MSLKFESGKIVELNTGQTFEACLTGGTFTVGNITTGAVTGGLSNTFSGGLVPDGSTNVCTSGYICGCGTFVPFGANHGCIGGNTWPTVAYQWGGYPIYLCSDKTAKAIQILKALEADKQIELKSVKRFIEMVEKIAAIL